MKKEEIYRHVGSIQQEAFVRKVIYEEGRAEAMHAYDVKCGDLRFTVMADKCMDVADFSYKGMNISFLAKPGLEGRNHFDTNGEEALRSIMGGLFFTCGLENICPPCTIEGKDYPMHGRMRTTPAEHVGADASWENGRYVITLTGQMREAELFGENMVLRRKITACYGAKSILIEDEVENESFREEDMMLLYHCNIGYPLLDEHARLYLPVTETKPRDEITAAHMENWDRMEAPRDNEPEYVYFHEIKADTEGNTKALVVNEKSKLGICLEWNKKNMPYFMEWKSTASGDYVMGLEPSNSSAYGKKYHYDKKDIHKLAPFAKEKTWLKFTVVEGEAEIKAAKEAIRDMV